MGIESFVNEDLSLDHIVLAGGKVIDKLSGEDFDVVTDEAGVKYFRFACEPLEIPPFENRIELSNYIDQNSVIMTVRADQVIAIVEREIPF